MCWTSWVVGPELGAGGRKGGVAGRPHGILAERHDQLLQQVPGAS